jgi:putative phage-type endonuclease
MDVTNTNNTNNTNNFDLEPLEDILDKLIFEDEPSIFTEDCAVELIETALHLMEEFMNDNPSIISEPEFHDILLEEIKDFFYVQMEDHILKSDYVEDDMNDLLEEAFNIYITTFHTERSIKTEDCYSDIKLEESKSISFNEHVNDINNIDLKDNDIIIIKNKIQKLREIPQPEQRTPEWYKFRWNLITASNAWKAFESQSTINQLIYEKCQPLRDFNADIIDEEIKMVNTNTTLHWGQKYEPLSVMLYEQLYDSNVEDFGCIRHPNYNFLGASPDGIIISSNTGRFGRMLEIKNIVNREITGIPKKEYWVQMQLQMEVCDLNECDFLETKFVEYPDYHTYQTDSSKSIFNGEEFNSFVTTKNGNYKGIIIYFHKNDGSPYYSYMPLNLWTPKEVTEWEENTIEKYQSEPYNYSYIKYIYWKLEKMSCVLVLRNNEWFKNNIGQLEKVWKIIEEERVSGYQHRAPIKKQKKETNFKPFIDSNKDECFLKIVKLDS